MPSTVRSLKYIGPYLAHNLRQAGITTLGQLSARLHAHTRDQNEAFLRHALVNERPQTCVGRAHGSKRPGYRYKTHTYNKCGYNSIANWAQNAGIPANKRPRPFLGHGTLIRAFPDDCAVGDGNG